MGGDWSHHRAAVLHSKMSVISLHEPGSDEARRHGRLRYCGNSSGLVIDGVGGPIGHPAPLPLAPEKPDKGRPLRLQCLALALPFYGGRRSKPDATI
jgi:hypothetical protein